MRIVVLGAGGQLGREVVATGLKRGHKLGAVVRRPPDPPFDSAVEVRWADARNEQEIHSAISGFDAVVNVIGGGTLRRNDVASSASAVVVPAVQAAGIKRYIAMSAAMVALAWPLFKYVLRPLIFRHIVAEHNRVEAIVTASALDWTIVRPTALTNHPAKGYLASREILQRNFITTRADVAVFIVDELEANKYVRKPVFIASQR
jgi:putative NADH-flavin reductase